MEINLNFNFGSNKIKANGILLIILTIAGLLRFYGIGFQDIWLDEIHTMKQSDTLLSLSEFHKIIMFREGIPHFYFLTIRFLAEIFGNNIILARSISAVSGIISVYFIYKLGKELFNKNVGYTAALFLTFNVYHIEYSQEARSYSMLAMFTVIAYYFLIKFIKKNNLKTAILLGLFTGLITNTHPIGLLNVASIYLTLFIALWMQDKSQRLTFFKQSFISGLITLLVFWPVYQIVAKVSKATVFWVAAPTYEGIKTVLIDVAGKSIILLGLTMFFLVLLAFNFIKNHKKETLNNNFKFSFITLLIWVLMCAGILIVKSYIGPSLILKRYFVANLPAFMLILAIGIQLIPSNIVKKACVLIVAGLLITQIVYPNNYYTTTTKAQFSNICNQVLKENPNNERIVTNWGWLLSYFLDRENKINNVLETDLQSYLEQVRDNALDQESFWYIDGNSRPYTVTSDIQEYIDKEFTIEKSIQNFDCWTIHFVSKKAKLQNEIKLSLPNFSNAQFDGSGKLMFFEKSKKEYKPFSLDQGEYEIELTGNSTPLKPINNENAIMNLYINNVLVKNFQLSETPNSTILIKYKQPTSGMVNFSLEFVNDFSNEISDRNAQISKINFKKII